MIVEVKLDKENPERIKVSKEEGKYFVSFLDRQDTRAFEANFDEFGQFYSVIIENKPYLIKFVEDGNVFNVSSGPYNTKVLAENQERKARRELRETFSARVNSIVTKIPGKIIGVMVTTGQTVKKGEELFILEAMKMENRIFAPRDGVVKEVFVNNGDILSIGDSLMSFEETN